MQRSKWLLSSFFPCTYKVYRRADKSYWKHLRAAFLSAGAWVPAPVVQPRGYCGEVQHDGDARIRQRQGPASLSLHRPPLGRRSNPFVTPKWLLCQRPWAPPGGAFGAHHWQRPEPNLDITFHTRNQEKIACSMTCNHI